MAKTNFQIFNEDNAPERTYNDSEYKEATQRIGGVMPGMALSRMHNKMYYQWSAMCKAIANLIVNHGRDCMDNDVDGITRYLEEAIESAATSGISMHRTAAELDHPEKSVKRKHLADNVYTLPAPEATNAARFVGGDHKVRDVTPGSIGAYSKGEVDSRVDAKINKSGDTMTGTLHFSHNGGHIVGKINDTDYYRITGMDAGGNNGYLEIAVADDIAEGIVVRQYDNIGGYYYGDFSKPAREAWLLNSDGNTSFPQAVTANTFYADDWFRARGNSGFYFQDHGGGWYMSDNDWIRVHENKNIYTGGKIKADSGFEGALHGRADSAGNSDTLGGQSLQWIVDQINAAKTGIVAGNLAQNGWVKFTNGLIVQWGTIPYGADGLRTVSYPIAFSQTPFILNTSRNSNEAKPGAVEGNALLARKINAREFKVLYATVEYYPVDYIALGI
mgnify:CR=1 FL=1